MPKFISTTQIEHNKEPFTKGQVLEMTAKEAAILVKIGALLTEEEAKRLQMVATEVKTQEAEIKQKDAEIEAMKQEIAKMKAGQTPPEEQKASRQQSQS